MTIANRKKTVITFLNVQISQNYSRKNQNKHNNCKSAINFFGLPLLLLPSKKYKMFWP